LSVRWLVLLGARTYSSRAALVGAAVYLASEQASSFVTGTSLRVDGGFTALTIW